MTLVSILYLIIAALSVVMIYMILKFNQSFSNLKEKLSTTVDENVKIKDALNNLDEVDEINQIYTYKYFHHLVEREIERAERYDNRFSLLFIELSGSKDHDIKLQNNIFRNILDIIKANIRLVDICFQNEITFSFVLVLTEVESTQAKKISERIYDSIIKLGLPEGVTTEMGIVAYPEDGTLRRNLIDKSRICLDRAKNMRNKRIAVFSEMD